MVPVLIGLSILIFALTRIGGDPAYAYVTEGMSPAQVEHIRDVYHLHDPLYVQYFYWLGGWSRGTGVTRPPTATCR